MNSPQIINDIVQRSVEIVGGHTKSMSATDVLLNTMDVRYQLHRASHSESLVIHYAFPGRVRQLQMHQLQLLLSTWP